MDLNLRGKVVVLTGASVGIGLAVAEAFAAEGVVPVAEVRVAGPVDSIDHQVQSAVTRSPEMADIAASTSGHESRTLGKIGAFL